MSKSIKLGVISIFLVMLFSVVAYAQTADIQLSAVSPSLTINPCQTAQFSFDVVNTGSNLESYEFGVKGLEQYSTLSTNFLVLAPGQYGRVDLFVNPECGLYGEQKISFLALAKSSNTLAKADLTLNILRNYDYTVAVANQINICNLKQTAIPISIQNNVPFVNQFDITINGPSWLGQEAKRVELGPNQNGITQLIAQPENPGSYLFDLTLNSIRGNVAKTGTENITVEKCYVPEVNIGNPSDIMISGHPSVYKVDVKNSGTRPDTYSFELDAPEWTSFSGTNVTLNPGQTSSFTLNANPVNITGNYKATLKLTSSQTNSVKEDSISLKVVNPEDAYNLKISPSHTRILYGQDVINVNLQNNGLLPGTYDLVLNGPKWSKLTSNSITLQPGEKSVVYIQTNANIKTDGEADYELQVIANVRNENVGFVNKFVVNLRQLTLGQEIYLFTMKYLVFIIAGVVVVVIALFFAIFGRKIARRLRNRKLRKQELAKVKAELKVRMKEEKLARKMLKESYVPKKSSGFGRKLLGLFMILVSLMILSGIVLFISGYAPFANEIFNHAQPQNKFSPIIKVDTSGLEAYGNTVIIRGKQTTVPIIVSNNYNQTLLFDVQTQESWIKTDVNSVELLPGKQEKVNLYVTPDQTNNGVYKVAITASLQNDNKLLTEDITLNIRQQNLLQDFLNYVWYLVAGIVLLVISIIMKKKLSKPSKKPSFEFSKIKYITNKSDLDLPSKK